MRNGFTHVHTEKAPGCNQTHTHTHAYTCTRLFCRGKLVLINLAGGTRHVFPPTSWPVPRAPQWKPSILVCLQFVCLNFLLICIIHWWPVGLVQEVLSEDCRGIFFTQTSYIMLSFSFPRNAQLSVGPPPSCPLPLRMKVSAVLKFYEENVTFRRRFSTQQCFDKGRRRRGLSAWAMKTVRRCTKHLWLCDYEGQMFFSPWAAYNTAYHPLDNFLFLPISEGPQILSGGKDAMPDYNKRSGLWCWYCEICYMLSQC